MKLILTGAAISGCLTGGKTDPPDPAHCDGLRAAEPGEVDGDADSDCEPDDAGEGDADTDADSDLDGDADSDAGRDSRECAPGDAASLMVSACHGEVIATGPRDDVGLACEEMVACGDDEDCALVVIDRCCGLEVASVPVELEDELLARTPDCGEAEPECERCLPLYSLAAICEGGLCSLRFRTGDER